MAKIKFKFNKLIIHDSPEPEDSGEDSIDSEEGNETYPLTYIISINGHQVANVTRNIRGEEIDEVVIVEDLGEYEIEAGILQEFDITVEVSFIGNSHGSVSFKNRVPWYSYAYKAKTKYLKLSWERILEGTHPVDDRKRFVCRQATESETLNTSYVADGCHMEIHPMVPPPTLPLTLSLEDQPFKDLIMGIRNPDMRDCFLFDEAPDIDENAPINCIINPPVIPILQEAGPETAAIIQVTCFKPLSVLDFRADDARLAWEYDSIKGGEIEFVSDPKGLRTLVRGVKKGEVILKVKYQNVVMARYRALVRPIKKIPCRFNLLWSDTVDPRVVSEVDNELRRKEKEGITPSKIRKMVAVANRYLRQMAVQMVYHDVMTIRDVDINDCIDSHQLKDQVFVLKLKDGGKHFTKIQVPDKKTAEWIPHRAFCVNFLPKVVNVNFFRRFSNPVVLGSAAQGSLAVEKGTTIKDISPSCVPFPLENNLCQEVEMIVYDEIQLKGAYENLFCLGMCNSQAGYEPKNGGPRLAHELLHVLGLQHRGRYTNDGSIAQDGLSYPPDFNLMHPSATLKGKYSLDILQALVIHDMNEVLGYYEK